MQVSFLGLLGVLFIGLKLTKVIAWSWWLVLLPIYGPAAFILGLALLATLGVGVLAAVAR